MGEIYCPFCGGAIHMSGSKEAIDFIEIECYCPRCSMEFKHRQEFAYSARARVAMNESFLDVWNRRIKGGT